MNEHESWNVVPNPVSAFSREENFAYRVRELVVGAFYAGARWADEHGGDIARRPLLYTAAELCENRERVDPIGIAAERFAATMRNRCAASFGLSESVAASYFANPLPSSSSVSVGAPDPENSK